MFNCFYNTRHPFSSPAANITVCTSKQYHCRKQYHSRPKGANITALVQQYEASLSFARVRTSLFAPANTSLSQDNIICDFRSKHHFALARISPRRKPFQIIRGIPFVRPRRISLFALANNITAVGQYHSRPTGANITALAQ